MSQWWDRLKNPNCDLCSLSKETHRVCSVTGRGPINARVMFVGEAPGSTEEKRGIPFVGQSGMMLLDLLQDAEFDANYTVVNSVCCRRPADPNKNTGNKAPKVEQWRTCSEHYLKRTIQKQNPQLIICFGLTAMKAVMNDSKITLRNARRKVFYREETVRGKGRASDTTPRTRKIPVVCTYHPAAILRDPTKRKIVHEDLRQFMRLLAGEELEEKPDDRVYILQGDDEDLGWNHSAGHALAFDFETTGLKPFAPDFRALACGVSQAPLHAHGFHIGDNLATDRLRDALARRSTTKIAHNAKFDYLVARRLGMRVQGHIFCTQTAFFLLDENYPDKRLEHLALLFTPMGEYAGDIKKNRLKPGYMEELDAETLLRYACGDADAAYRLYLLFEHRLKNEKLRRAFHLQMRTLRTLVDVEYNGMFVDTDALDMEAGTTEKQIQRIKRWLDREHPGIDNWKSNPQVARLIYQDFKIRPGRRTKTGAASVDELALQSAHRRADTSHQQKTIRGILAMRKLEKVMGTYIRPLRDEHIMPDGRAHPVYNLTGAVSRLSCKDPNAQNIPPNFRKVFTSRWEDEGVIVNADGSQMELRVLAHYSKEPRLLDAFEHGRDVHLETAAEVFDKPPSKITKEERYLAKTTNFLIIYGGGANKLASVAGIPVPVASQFIERYKARLPRVQRWIHKIHRECLIHGQVRDLFGRIRRLPIDDPESDEGHHALRQAVNFPIQSTASGLNLLCMNDIHAILRRGMRSVLIGTVHDSQVFDAWLPELEELCMIIDEVWGRPDTHRYGFEFNVPLKVDISFGPNWYEQKEIPR